ncbi:gamma-glutamyl-gamma-aminobutyrate hydrolase family protein [Bacillus sp. AGMB 02131]|uniref:Gamma-glutamyl-gamma-aminobutyrate hydrolase family protein n=1 Tax=Peribacillus faecalis TaxID=2772559 RepID=A0A927HB49_9BACI|nr:gamma-glutamyl-gamma-aminobutyrate hydrolase family protein [Peribacillus faecalis]MBD3107033.1 gamma-glutamyl-gamma-aminobutyrate hydrolase family protein [Peribacillus faecalis]
MKPLIGITSNLRNGLLTLSTDNIQSVTLAGGVPIVLPNVPPEEAENEIIASIDGLLVTGGGDIDPLTFGEEPHQNLRSVCPERDRFEMSIIKKMFYLNKPILAICRGCQVLNIALDGDIYQDIYSQIQTELIQHTQIAPRYHTSHYINIKKDGLLYEIAQSERMRVNSYHHQAVRRISPYLSISATANDGIIEAIESSSKKFVLGVQWHPENMFATDDAFAGSLFRRFINACIK